MSRTSMRRVVVGLGVAVAALALGGLSSTPALAADSGADLSKTLHVSMKMTQATYKPGDVVHVLVSLTNSGTSALHSVQAWCNGGGFPNRLVGTAPGWAALNGPSGLDLASGETKTLDLSDALPAAAYDYGFVAVDCKFGPNALTTNGGPAGFPFAQASAKVPGAIAEDCTVKLENPEMKPIPNTKVYLLDPDTKQIVGRSVTDTAGMFGFRGIPAGQYQIYVVGPWQNAYSVDDQPIIETFARSFCQPGHLTGTLGVRPGPDKPDLEPAGGTSVPTTPVSSTSVTSTPVTSTTAGAGGTSNPSSTSAVIATTTAVSAAALPKRMPNTGANVFGPTVAGLALLAAGVGALLVVRRRKATS